MADAEAGCRQLSAEGARRLLPGGSFDAVRAAQPGPSSVTYEKAPRQSMVEVFKVLMKKHLLLGFRRKRIIGTICRMIPFVGIQMVVMIIASSHDDYSGYDNVEATRSQIVVVESPICGTLFVLLMFSQLVIEVVTDKELKMKYVQQVAGVSDFSYWLSYYAFYFGLTTSAVIVYMLCLMVFVKIYKFTNFFLFFMTFVLSFLQTFFATMVVSTVFERARLAAVICSIFGAIVVVGQEFFMPFLKTTDVVTYFLISLVPFAGTANLLSAIGVLEAMKLGFTFDSWSTTLDPAVSTFPVPGPPAGYQFLILVADCLLYGLFATWFYYVWQGEFGAARPWNFCFMPAYICPRRSAQTTTKETAALKLEGLVKEFHTKQGVQRAVDGMSLELARAEIFALLGHNGAGKTTAINCITGMLPMTAGSVEVYGIDVTTRLEEARKHLSVCPQDNPLYLEFSVDEHLQFFAALRGVPAARAKGDIDAALDALGLVEKRSARTATLSGGQKRRLWVATSLLGQTPVVFLDEPTSGMDPANRRKLWSLLVQMKNHGRCILFTTHYLDEADVLAERKAVLDKGKVKAIGTSWELKRQFGMGYHLRVVCAPDSANDLRDKISSLVMSHIPNAQNEVVPNEERSQRPDAPKQWSFTLPYGDVGKFGPMLELLEARASTLGIQDYALETTTLEEVFMALGQGGGDVEEATGMMQVAVVVPQGYDPSQPFQVPHPENGVATPVNFPPGAVPGQQYTISVPKLPHALNLASADVRIPVTWATCFFAIMTLRLRQVLQAKRSLLATFVIPGALMLLCGWCAAGVLKLMNVEAPGGGRPAPTSLGIFGSAIGLCLAVCLAIALPYFATTLVADRVHRCTYVATSQGLPLTAYWAGTFANNYLQNFILCMIVPVCLIVFHCPYYGESKQILKILPAAFFAPVPMLLFGYNASRFFSNTESCSKFIPAISLMASVVPFLAVYILISISTVLQISGLPVSVYQGGDIRILDTGLELHRWAYTLHWVFAFLDPFYCLAGTFAAIGLAGLGDLLEISASCAQDPSCKAQWDQLIQKVDFAFPKMFGSHVLVPLVGQLVLSGFFVLALTWDVERFSGAAARRLQAQVDSGDTAPQDSNAQDIEQGEQDLDVADEERRVASIADGGQSAAEQSVLYRRLVHTYGLGSAREVCAVRGISLGVKQGECFTLLGPNGAGKTTTLDVLTGAIFPPTKGDVFINGHSITASAENRLKALQCLGNCPQVDPLWPTLTGRQHLHFYAQIKGLPKSMHVDQTNMLLKALGFNDFDADKPTQGYSGGMKRKLSLAIALIGSPPTLLLDEPSAAVDAAAKRHLWRVVKQRGAGQTVILTTHSMEEAEALSDRLAIQVQGKLRCLGTPDHIKNTHGSGYQLEIICAPKEGGSFHASFVATPVPEVEKFVTDFCPQARLLEYHEGRYTFRLPVLRAVGASNGELSVAKLFTHMCHAEAIGVTDYSISRPSLEQVFLRFAKEQQAV